MESVLGECERCDVSIHEPRGRSWTRRPRERIRPRTVILSPNVLSQHLHRAPENKTSFLPLSSFFFPSFSSSTLSQTPAFTHPASYIHSTRKCPNLLFRPPTFHPSLLCLLPLNGEAFFALSSFISPSCHRANLFQSIRGQKVSSPSSPSTVSVLLLLPSELPPPYFLNSQASSLPTPHTPFFAPKGPLRLRLTSPLFELHPAPEAVQRSPARLPPSFNPHSPSFLSAPPFPPSTRSPLDSNEVRRFCGGSVVFWFLTLPSPLPAKL